MRCRSGRVPYLIIYHNKISDIKNVGGEDEDQLSSKDTQVSYDYRYVSRTVVESAEDESFDVPTRKVSLLNYQTRKRIRE